MNWSTEWTKSLVLSDEFDVFPLQFSNINRIESNDAVYIFDEVGCGKTISAGLMALHYLANTPDDSLKNVQIITINSLVKPAYDNGRGQFLNDWFEKLPFNTLGYSSKVSICNNHYRNIEKLMNKRIGLLIIDEAHLFLEDTFRLENLMSLNANKVIFLTATPIKHGKRDLIRYCNIADSVTKKECSREWIKLLVDPEVPICEQFDSNSPVTRYFKDTVVALEYTNENEIIDFDKNTVKRLVPQIWEFNDKDNKAEELVKHLIALSFLSKQTQNNRFVIFTRYIEREANVIIKEFESNASFFEKWHGETIQGKLTYVMINGTTAEKATTYSHNGLRNPLPDIIVITYQIAEQGINLPGYNYVINYHIPAYPASLEQRFGRIDRMGKKNPSQYPEINMVFLMSKNGWETYKMNFYTAVSIYRYRLLTHIPAKNVLLTKGILGRLNAERDGILKYISDVNTLLEDNDSFNRTVVYFRREFQRKNNLLTCLPDEREKYLMDTVPDKDDELTRFCVEHDIDLDFDEEDYVLKERICKQLEYLSEIFQKDIKTKVTDKDWRRIIEQIGDKIYYFGSDENDEIDSDNLKTLDAVHDCAEFIYESEDYKKYEKWFNDQVRIPKLFEKWSPVLEEYFEDEFLNGEGCFENIFTYDYSKLLAERVIRGEKWTTIKEAEKRLLVDNAAYGIPGLPFFKMVNIFRKVIFGYVWTDKKTLRKRYDRNVMKSSYRVLETWGYIPKEILNRQSKTVDFSVRFYTKSSNEVFECRRWLKLFLHCVLGNAEDYIKVIDIYRELTLSCDDLIDKMNPDSTETEIINRIKSEKKNEVDCLLQLISNIKAYHHKRISLFYILFSRYDSEIGAPKWRKPYLRIDGWVTRSFSDILFINRDGKRKYQIWGLRSPEMADLWTYLFYSDIHSLRGYTVENDEWWFWCFLRQRCFSNRRSDKLVLEILEPENMKGRY